MFDHLEFSTFHISLKHFQTDNLIGIDEAAHILGFKQRKKVDLLIAEGKLEVLKKPHSKRKWLDREQVINLPVPLPIPPPPKLFEK